MNIAQWKQRLESEAGARLLTRLYGAEAVAAQTERYETLLDQFASDFGDQDVSMFTSPGRSEIGGNHTDHNNGRVLAASINLDCVGVAAKTEEPVLEFVSVTYDQRIRIDLHDIDYKEGETGTLPLVKGMLKGFLEMGLKIGGFKAYITSNVISAAGISSSAAFEMLICSMLNAFYNDGAMDVTSYAHIGRYAENNYWLKASGLLDQMACAVGGLITIDFKDPKQPVVEPVAFDFASQHYDLMIVNTGKGHADLSAEYSSVPAEMKAVAQFFGKEVLREVDPQQLADNLAAVRAKTGDRAVMRALHFFYENERVLDEVEALKNNDFQKFLTLITESGNSSWKWLQNCYYGAEEQGITVALAYTELFLRAKGVGACRVHGGGFAGVIMAMIPSELGAEYTAYMEGLLGEGNVYRMSIRPIGAVCLDGML
ncbi:MAG: galactokinase [Clostridiales bacterium]|nr:galactokinase [Clostridiales bacterium]